MLISFLIKNDFSRLELVLTEDDTALLSSKELFGEFIEVCKRPKFRRYFSPLLAKELFSQLELHSIMVNTVSEVNVCADPKDNFLLSLAKDGQATHLLTGDKDLLKIKRFENTRILTISAYLKFSLPGNG